MFSPQNQSHRLSEEELQPCSVPLGLGLAWDFGTMGVLQVVQLQQCTDTTSGYRGRAGCCWSCFSPTLHPCTLAGLYRIRAAGCAEKRAQLCRQTTAVCSPAGGRRGRHRWQQMLSSVEMIEAKHKTKKILATGEQPNKKQHRGREKGSRPKGPLHGA